MMCIIAVVIGIIASLPGGPWLLQGLVIGQVRPILYFADCAAIQRPLLTCAVFGAIALVAWGRQTSAAKILNRTRRCQLSTGIHSN
jgi:hypothetical protein